MKLIEFLGIPEAEEELLRHGPPEARRLDTGRIRCSVCEHPAHDGKVCMRPLYWGPKHDADCGCPHEVCFGEGMDWL